MNKNENKNDNRNRKTPAEMVVRVLVLGLIEKGGNNGDGRS